MSDSFGVPSFLVMPPEAEQLIERLGQQPVDAVGVTKDWMAYHHTIEKLNLQAHQSAQRKQDNFVIESLVTYQKFPTLIVNLLSAEMWKTSVLPLLTCKDQEAASLRLYFIMYHEAALVNLLEVAFFHEHVVETLDDDMMLEVIDYCMRKLTWLVGLPRDAIATSTTFHKSGQEVVAMMQAQSAAAELKRQQMELEFRIAVQCVTLLRYIAERLHALPLSSVSRLLDKHDALLTLAVLVENPPWTHKVTTKGTDEVTVQWKKFAEQKWTVVEPSDLLVLTSTEAQVWLAVYYLICTKSAREHYEVTQYRKDQLLRMRKYLNELLLDQLPVLADIQRYLDELAIMQVPANAIGAKSTLVMEAVPYVRENLTRTFTRQFRAIAKRFDEESELFTRGEDLRALAELYQMDGIEELLDESEEPRREREQLRAATIDTEEEEEEAEAPTRVVLVFKNRSDEKEKKKKKKKPLIVEIIDGDEPSDSGDDMLQNRVVMIYEVDVDSQKLMETKTSRYFRYTLKPSQGDAKMDAVPFVHRLASVDATVEFGGDSNVELNCASLELPLLSSADPKPPTKLWKQIGSLQEDSQVVVQCQFISHTSSDNQVDHDRADGGDHTAAYRLGAMFLSVPL